MTLYLFLKDAAALIGFIAVPCALGYWRNWYLSRKARKEEELEDQFHIWERQVLSLPPDPDYVPSCRELARLGIGIGPCRDCSALGTEMCNDCQR